jgi:hypothetical protein
LIRSASVEVGRTKPEALIVALHPGTVATRLSQPFTPTHEVFTPTDAANRMLAVINTVSETGQFLAYDGTKIPW